MKLCLVCNFQFEDEQELCPKDYSKLVPLGKDQLIGKLIQDRYRVECVIAKGSMGVVYKATQELIGRDVAVKVLHGYLVSDEESIKRFHKEAKAASRLNHPNITTLYDYGVLGSGQPYIVMDLLRGSSLSEVLKQRDYMPLDEALVIFKQVCDAMAEAHRRGVVHRDLKPENIMLDYTDKGVNVKVVDFGIAKFLQEQEDTIGKITKTGTVCGSPTYMSPEQCDDNSVDHRSDIYSLGILIYETITGKVPFASADIYSVMTMHVKATPPRLKEVRPDLDFPLYLEQVIEKVLSKDPNDRYQSADDLWDALKGKSSATGNRLPTSATSESEVGGGKNPTATITEDEVKNVINKALKSRMLQSGDPSGEDNDQDLSIDADAVRKKVQAATLELATRKNQAKQNHSGEKPKMRRGVSTGARVMGLLQSAFPAVLTLSLTGALFWVVSHEANMQATFKRFKFVPSMSTKSGATNDGDVDALMAQNKVEQARAELEKRKREGRINDSDLTTLNSIYLRLAKKEAKAKHFKQAASLLNQISGDEKDDDEVRLLLKKYKKAAGK